MAASGAPNMGFPAAVANRILDALHPILSGVLLQVGIYGVVFCQTCNYFAFFKQSDDKRFKILVAVLFAGLTGTVALNCWNVQVSLSTALRNPTHLVRLTRINLVSTGAAMVTSAAGVGFFWHRTWKISGTSVRLLCTGFYASSMAAAVALLGCFASLGLTHRITMTVNQVQLWCAFATEVLLAGVLIAKLRRSGTRGMLSGQNPFERVMRMSLQTSSFVALNLLACSLSISINTKYQLAAVFYPLLPATIVMSVLYTLNSRIESRETPVILATKDLAMFDDRPSPQPRDLEEGEEYPEELGGGEKGTFSEPPTKRRRSSASINHLICGAANVKVPPPALSLSSQARQHRHQQRGRCKDCMRRSDGEMGAGAAVGVAHVR